MRKIVFLDRSTIAPQIRLRRPSFEHELVEHASTHPEQVVERLRGATVAILNKVPLTAPTLAQLPDLRLIAVAATGTDCVDKTYCEAHGIAVANIRGYAVNTVPEHAFALILRAAPKRGRVSRGCDRRALAASGPVLLLRSSDPRSVRARASGSSARACSGNASRNSAGRSAWCRCSPPTRARSGLGPLYTPWNEVLETSDIITLHSPLTSETRGMIAMPEFRSMKRRPLIINTARGGLVDEADLVQALDAGLISGIGFDVVTGEPPPSDNVLMRVAGRPNVILTPHVAWASDEAQQALADQLMDNIENFFAGRPANLVYGAY